MSSAFQIIFGSLLLLICSGFHLLVLLKCAGLLKSLGVRATEHQSGKKWRLLSVLAFSVVIITHTVQVWLWALSFLALGAISDFSDALYFALVTYTTLGYGDVLVSQGYRIYAAMAAVTGLLNFGLSTAFLVGLMGRLFEREFGPK